MLPLRMRYFMDSSLSMKIVMEYLVIENTTQINQIQLVMDTVFGKNVLNFSFNFIFFIKMYTKIRLLSENNRNWEKVTIVLGEANLIFYCTESWENYFWSFGQQNNNNHKFQDHEFVDSGF